MADRHPTGASYDSNSTPDWTNAAWRKSTRSGAVGECVEFAIIGDEVRVRHSSRPDAEVLIFPRATWQVFVLGVKNGDFDGERLGGGGGGGGGGDRG